MRVRERQAWIGRKIAEGDEGQGRGWDDRGFWPDKRRMKGSWDKGHSKRNRVGIQITRTMLNTVSIQFTTERRPLFLKILPVIFIKVKSSTACCQEEISLLTLELISAARILHLLFLQSLNSHVDRHTVQEGLQWSPRIKFRHCLVNKSSLLCICMKHSPSVLNESSISEVSRKPQPQQFFGRPWKQATPVLSHYEKSSLPPSMRVCRRWFPSHWPCIGWHSSQHCPKGHTPKSSPQFLLQLGGVTGAIHQWFLNLHL